MTYLQYAGITKRAHLARQLNQWELIHKAVEVGTHRGEFAKEFIKEWNEPGKLYCVDHWLPNYHPTDPAAKGNREEDYHQAEQVLLQYRISNRAVIMRMPSEVACMEFSALTLDMVYVDSNHSRIETMYEFERWWPKVRPGGIMAVHDYVCPGESDGLWGPNVQWACEMFSKKYGLVTYLVPEEDSKPWTAYFRKT